MDISYVYAHYDNGELVYLGKGKNGRAWTTCSRGKEHEEWMREKLPELDVRFIAKNLDANTARDLEKSMLKVLHPRWNRYHTNNRRAPNRNIDEATVRRIRTLLEVGTLTQTEIADIFDVAMSTVSSIKHNKIWTDVE